MKTLLLALLALMFSVLVTLLLREDSGYVLLSYRQWTLESSLALFLLLDLLLFAALYLLLGFFMRLWRVPARVQQWQLERDQRRARESLTQGLLALAEGNWGGAEKALTSTATLSETPLLNYLAAARAAQQQAAYDRRDRYLQLAHESMPSADVAVGLTQAELQLDRGQLEQALATLRHLRQLAPHHAHVLQLLQQLYQRIGEWDELEQLLPELKRRKVMDESDLAALSRLIGREQLKQASQQGLDALQRRWKALPAALRKEHVLVAEYAGYLLQEGEHDQAEALLRERLCRQWDNDLLPYYGRVRASDPAQQLASAERWLDRQSRNPLLLLILARLSIRNRLWGKARSYLEATIGVAPSIAAYRELGALLERMGEREQAMDCYRAGLALASDIPLEELPESIETPANGQAVASLDMPTDINPPRTG